MNTIKERINTLQKLEKEYKDIELQTFQEINETLQETVVLTKNLRASLVTFTRKN